MENVNAGAGLFGASVGEIKNLQLLDINIRTSKETGGLVGIMAGEYCFPKFEEVVYKGRLWNTTDSYTSPNDCSYMRRNTMERMIRTLMRYSRESVLYYVPTMQYNYANKPGGSGRSVEEAFNFVTSAYKSITNLPPELKVATKKPRISSVFVSGNIIKKKRINKLKPEVYKMNMREYGQFCRGVAPYFPACINPNFVDNISPDYDPSDSTGTSGTTNFWNDAYGVQEYLSNGFINSLTQNQRAYGLDATTLNDHFVPYYPLAKIEQIALGGAVGVMTFGELFEIGTDVSITQEEVELRENYLSAGGVVGFIGLNHSVLMQRPQDNLDYFRNLIHIKKAFSLGSIEGAQIEGGIVGAVSFNPNNFLMTMVYRFYNRDTIHIEDVYSLSTISGLKVTGGLIGLAQVPIMLNNSFFKGQIETYQDYTYDHNITTNNPERFKKIKTHPVVTANDVYVFPDFSIVRASQGYINSKIPVDLYPMRETYGCFEPQTDILTKPENCFNGYAVASSTFKNIYYINPNMSLDVVPPIGGSDATNNYALPHWYMSMNLGITGRIDRGSENQFENFGNSPEIMKYRNSGRYPLLFEKVIENVKDIASVKILTKYIFIGFNFTSDWILPPGGKTYPILKGSFGGATDVQPTESVQSD